MSKKELLERIEKLEELVSAMQAEINLLSMAVNKPTANPIWIYSPYPYPAPTLPIWTTPIITYDTKTGG